MPKNSALLALLLLLLALLAHGGAIFNDFVVFDDHLYVTENPHVLQGLTLDSTNWAFRSFQEGNWHPLTWLTHMAVVDFKGLDPVWHHLLNVLLHAANVLLLFLFLSGSSGAPLRSFCVAALFAVHPLHVESVAWVAERKDVLSMLFGLLTLLAYVRHARGGGKLWYFWVMAFLVLTLMAKPLFVTLPVLLLLLDYWPLGRWRAASLRAVLREDRGLLLEKLPLLALVAGASLLAMAAQHGAGAMESIDTLGFGRRLGNALTSYLAYLWKLAVPLDLAPIYPMAASIPLWKTLGAGALLAAASALAVGSARRTPYVFTGWFWYLVAMLPMIGLVQVGIQSMADRYAYLPFVGLYVILVWGAGDLLQRLERPSMRQAAGALLLTLALLWLLPLTLQQVRLWKDSIRLFGHAVEVVEENYPARRLLALAYTKEGRLHDAMQQYRKVLAMRPSDPKSHWHLAKGHANLGEYETALQRVNIGLEKFPETPQLHNLKGYILFKLQRMRASQQAFARAVELDPADDEAQNNLRQLNSLLQSQAAPAVDSSDVDQERKDADVQTE